MVVCLQIGNSPTMISKAQLAEMLPRWDRYVRAIHNDSAADKALGWAQEMYGFALALANSPGGVPAVQYKPQWMVQPPFQLELRVDACQVRLLSCRFAFTSVHSAHFGLSDVLAGVRMRRASTAVERHC